MRYKFQLGGDVSHLNDHVPDKNIAENMKYLTKCVSNKVKRERKANKVSPAAKLHAPALTPELFLVSISCSTFSSL